jgi:hypothetical protein
MKITADEYPAYRAWFAAVTPDIFPEAHGNPEIDPMQVLDRMAASAPSRARQGLALAIGDVLEFAADWDRSKVQAVDDKLAQANLPTLSEFRARFSREIARIHKRGRIANEREYYAVRNVVESVDAETSKSLWDLLAAYENQPNASH